MKALVLAAAMAISAATLTAQTWQWVNQFSVTSGSLTGGLAFADKQDNLFYTGTNSGDAYFQGIKIDPGFFIIKLRPSGQVDWIRSFPNTYNTSSFNPDNLGGFYIRKHL